MKENGDKDCENSKDGGGKALGAEGEKSGTEEKIEE
jgi:hypothetical protein